MQPDQWCVRSGTDPAHWPQLVCPSAAPGGDNTAALHVSDPLSFSEDTKHPTREVDAAALVHYARQWLDDDGAASLLAAAALTSAAHTEKDTDDAERRGPVKEATVRDESPIAEGSSTGPSAEATVVSSVAMLNALLVSLPPAAAVASSRAAQPAARPDGTTILMDAPLPILLAPDASGGNLSAVAAQLLRQSKWLAAGVSHAAGTMPRLPSAHLLSYAYQHALRRPGALSSSPSTLGAAASTAHGEATASPTSFPSSSIPGDDVAAVEGLGSSEAHSPHPSTDASEKASSRSPASYRGCLVLLLFHPMRFLRIWARDALLRLICEPPSLASSAAARSSPEEAERRLVLLLGFALQLLCTLKHVSLLFELIGFTETRTPVASPPASSASGERRESGVSPAAAAVVVVAQERVRAVVEGVFHVLTLLTAWDARCGAAIEAWTAALRGYPPTAPEPPSPAPTATPNSSGFPLLSRCRATVMLLGSSFALYGVHALHRSVCRAIAEARASSHRLHPLAANGSSAAAAAAAATDAARTSRAAMAQLLHHLNDLLSANPRMLKAVAVPALTIKKTLVKVLVHCLLDNANGLASSREDEAWRRTRLTWIWSFAAALDPPTTRVAAPLSSGHADAGRSNGAPATSSPALDEGASNVMCVPLRTAGWLLKPLLKNAEQQFQWAQAMNVAKGKPSNALHDAAAARAAADATAVLDKAVYGLYLLLDTLVGGLPALLSTRYFHDILASYESSLLTLAIGGIVHTRTSHALHLHRLLLMADVRAFAASAAAQDASPHTPPSHEIETPERTGNIGSRASAFVAQPAVCLQRVWLTLPTLLTQVCKTSLMSTSSTQQLPLPHVLARLCGALTVLIEPDAAPCAQWLLLSPTEAMATAPPPFQWVVQRCLKTMCEALRDQHDVVERAWLGVSTGASASARSSAMVAASHMLTEGKELLHLIHALPFAAAEDGGLRRLGEQLASIFCSGVAPTVTHAMSAEAAEWVWRNVVLAQPALATSLIAPTLWDVSSPSVANTARAQGRQWLALLAQCTWPQQTDWAVRCGWWMCTLLADVVALEAEQRCVLAEGVLLSLPTTPVLHVVAKAPHVGGSSAEDRSESDLHTARSPEYIRQEAREREEGHRLYMVVQHLLVSVLRKAETYPRNSLDRLLLHISDALPAARVSRDAAFQRAVQPLLVRLCQRRPDVQKILSAHGAPWLQQWTAVAVQSTSACLAEQERRFRQFEMEEESWRREQDDATRLAAMEAQVRRINETQRVAEMDRVRSSGVTAASLSAAHNADGSDIAMHAFNNTNSASSSSSISSAAPMRRAAIKEENAGDSGSGGVGASRLFRQQRLFPDRPMLPAHEEQQSNGAKRERSDAQGTSGLDEVVDLDVDSDVEEDIAANKSLVDRVLISRQTVPQPPLKTPKLSPAGAPPPPPTRLQQKLQAINARNTHRFNHADQLRRLQERLCRVAASTNLLQLQPPLINDIIGSSSQCMALEVPVLPEVFVAAASVLGSEAAVSSTAVPMPFGDAANAYAVRFAPHIALELRCDILRAYEDLMDGAARSAPHIHAGHRRPAYSQPPPAGPPPTTPPISWTQLLPLHPTIPCTSLAVQNVASVVQKSSSGTAHQAQSFYFAIRACANAVVSNPQRQRAVDPAVRAVADQGLSAGLSEGDVVVVLLPLHTLAAAWVERQLNVALESLPEPEQTIKVQEVLSLLPRSWRTLGCVTQVCYVHALLPGERTAQLCAYPPTEAQGGGAQPLSPAPPLRFLHAMHMAYQTPQNTFYVKKLTSLHSFQMELAALHKIDHTRFAATLYDPCHAATLNASYYGWITNLLTAPGQAQLPLLSQLRSMLLLQRQLNDWQIRAIVAVLFATCGDWDEGAAQRCMKAPAPRAPEVLLIEGPPGTGKTQTIGSLTLNVLHHLSRTRGANARVLVCAPSNCAVDEALLRVVHLREQLVSATNPNGGTAVGATEPRPAHDVLYGGILRVGMRDRVDPDVLRLAHPVFFDDVVEQRLRGVSGTYAGRGGGRGRGGSGGGAGAATSASALSTARASVIDSASVIFSTLGSLHHISRQVQGLTFDVVIVDEASQGTEPAVLQALILARNKCVLVGDSKQLQPTILSTEASRCGLRRSLLVRLLACGHKSFLLRTQYRMHPDICAFPNAYFYEGKLETDRSVRLRARMESRTSGLLSDMAVHDPANLTVAQRLGRCPRSVFVDVPQATMERRRGKSLFNRAEALAVVQYMRQLRTLLRLSVKDMAPQLGIITFYNAQKDLILSLLTREERQSGLQVASVDSFQGKEKRIILLSCVRTVRRAQLLPKLPRSALRDDEAERSAEGRGTKRSRDGHNVDDDDTAGEGHNVASFEERLENRHVGRFGLGFLADGHRLNVALTRAQDLCVCFGSRDSLQAIGEAVLAARGHHPRANSTHAVTTADSAPQDVVRQLDADDEDPLALYRMLQHVEQHDVCVHPPARQPPPLEAFTDSVQIVDGPASATVTAACVRYEAQSQLVKELTKRARLITEHETPKEVV